MARVPVYNGPQVRSSALSPQFQRGASNPDAFGAAQGAQLQRMGNAAQSLGEAFEVAVERQATREALDAETVLRKEWGLVKSEMIMRQGANAAGVAKEAQDWWDKAMAERTKGLGARSKDLLTQQAARLRDGEVLNLVDFENRQQRVAFEQSIEANNTQAILDAANDPSDDKVLQARTTLAENVAALAADKGWAPGSAELRVAALKATNTLHSQVLNGMLSNPMTPPEKMEQYLQKHGAEMDPATRTQMTSKVTERRVDVVGQRTADSMADMPYEEQLKKAAEIKDPLEREATRKWIKTNAEDKRIARGEREREASDKVWQLVAQGTPLRGLPSALLDQMDGKERVQVNEHYEAQRKARLAEAEGRPVKTDYKVYEDIRNLPTDAFLKLRISTYADRLSREDMRSLIEKQAALRDPSKAPRVATTEQNISAYITRLGMKPGDEKTGEFRARVFDVLQQRTREKGKDLTFEEEQQVLDEMTLKGDLSFFGSDRPYAVVPPEDRQRFVERNIPLADRTEIEKDLKARGIPVTPDLLVRIYTRAQKKQ